MASETLNSPMSRAYFCQKTDRIIHCAMGLKHHIDVEALKKAFSVSIMLKHPRFASLMVRDQHNGSIERWERVQVNIDEHIIVHHPTTAIITNLEDEEVEVEINAFLADISVSTPLSEKKPLWEVHGLMGLKCVVFRMHHGLGDGSSLMSMLNACFGENTNNDHIHNNTVNVNNNNGSNKSKKRSWRERNVCDSIQGLWLTLVFGLRLLGGLLWVKNKQNVFSSGADGVELLPRKLVTVKFKLQDFKRIKNVIPSATINDVLLGVISCGLSKYLETKSPKGTPQGLDVTAIVTVNLRKDAGLQKMSDLMGTTKANSSSFGNKTGTVLVPMTSCHNGLHPLGHVKSMKAIMDQKKKSYEANLAYISQKFVSSCFGPKVANWCNYRVVRNKTFLISNIVGPLKGIVIGDNPVTFLRVNGSGSPHAMTLPFVSYKGNADLQLMVARDIIHDPEFLANCIQGSLNQMIEGLHQ